ncbi:hypothetical protein [Deinococcus detaillensis]|uniref:hypothetical protein n=1 Tax=Deinococcus detaillensis TaxID=2592048 RepID=UPI00163DB53E|nr:hypothetical protein [Deinococcus detaillensis]
MTQPEQTRQREGEILISGVDTGPEKSANESPTEMSARLRGLDDPEARKRHEPDNEDG